jgi:hypothetical protein
MKALLVRAAFGALMAVSVVGCNNVSGAVGFPTIIVNAKAKSFVFNTTTSQYDFSVDLEIQTLPGSPGGTVTSFGLASGGTFAASIYVPKCDVPTAVNTPNCVAGTINIKRSYAIEPAASELTLISYTAVSDNGIPASRSLGAPQPLKP